MNKLKLLEIHLEIDSIIIGERVKGGVFRPCQEIIPSSTIEGALKHYFGIKVPAVGIIEKQTYQKGEFTYSIKDKFLNISKMPIFTEYLRPKTKEGKIGASIYIPYNKGEELQNEMQDTGFQMGALKSKSFGKCKVENIETKEFEIKQGILAVKLFEDECKDFGIKVISPLYGYLFKPDTYYISGVYKRVLFPKSLVEAPEILLKRVTYYDEQNG